MEGKQVLVIVGVVVGVLALLLVILLPMSYSSLEYNEYGFKRRKTTGTVDLGTVYGPGGKHFLGPDYEFKKFSADMHYISVSDVAVFTSDRLEVSLTATFQYFLRKDDLPLLHREYDIYYEPVLQKNALDALKRAATQFSTREMILERSEVEESLFMEVKQRLGGRCCELGCDLRGDCLADCVQFGTCTDEEKGFFADVRYFQLLEIEIPSDVESRYLQALVLQEETEKEKFLQEAQVVVKQTDAAVNEIENEAAEIGQNATAQSSLLRTKADSQSTALVEAARSEGLKNLYTKLGITDVNQKSSFDYLRTLKDMQNVHLSVDFDQMIAGNFGG